MRYGYTDEELEKINQFVESLNEEQYEYYCNNIHTITYHRHYNINIAVEEPLTVAYFRIYNHREIAESSKVMQLHFKDGDMEYHPDPFNKDIWVPNDSELYDIKNLLYKKSDLNDCTKWEMLCYQWNYLNLLIDGNVCDYLDGKYDKKYTNNKILSSIYVPSTQQIPKKWIYNPEKKEKEKFKYW